MPLPHAAIRNAFPLDICLEKVAGACRWPVGTCCQFLLHRSHPSVCDRAWLTGDTQLTCLVSESLGDRLGNRGSRWGTHMCSVRRTGAQIRSLVDNKPWEVSVSRCGRPHSGATAPSPAALGLHAFGHLWAGTATGQWVRQPLHRRLLRARCGASQAGITEPLQVTSASTGLHHSLLKVNDFRMLPGVTVGATCRCWGKAKKSL